MRVWTVLTQKGGAAKTTTTLNLAIAAVEQGEKTLVIDCDSVQGSSSQWWESREADQEAPMLIAVKTSDVEKNLAQAKEHGFTHVLIDTPGYAGLTTNATAQQATFCIVPTQPSIMDMRATVPSADMLKTIDKSFGFLLTRCPVQGTEVEEASRSFKSLGLVCPTRCYERKAYKRAYASGMGVIEYAKLDNSAKIAAEEIRSVYKWFKKKEDRLNKAGFSTSTAKPTVETLEAHTA